MSQGGAGNSRYGLEAKLPPWGREVKWNWEIVREISAADA